MMSHCVIGAVGNTNIVLYILCPSHQCCYCCGASDSWSLMRSGLALLDFKCRNYHLSGILV